MTPLERRHLVSEILGIEHWLCNAFGIAARPGKARPCRGASPRERVCRRTYDLAPAFAYFLLKRSMRPAVSISFCLPVKNGWQLEQMSIPKSPRVEKVSCTIPHAQVMRAGR